MKKITLLCALALFTISMTAQDVSETFDDGTAPDGWELTTVTGDCDWAFTATTPSSQDDFTSTAIVYDDDGCGNGAAASNLTITTAVYDLSGSEGAAVLTYEVWFQEFGDQTFTVEAYDGAAWNTLLVYDANTGGVITETIDLTDYVNTDFQVRYTYDDNGGDWGWGAGIDTFAITGVLSAETNSLDGFSMFPNPATNVLNVTAASTISSVKVYNLLGQVVVNKGVNALSDAIDVSNLKTGAYLVQVTAEGQTGTYKFIKQ